MSGPGSPPEGPSPAARTGRADRAADWLLRARRVVDAVSDVGGAVARYAVLAVFVVGIVNVVLRYVGRATGQTLVTNLYVDLQWQLFALMVLVALGYGMKEGVNPRVDIVYARFSPRGRALVDLAGHLLLLLPFCVVAIAVTWPFAMTGLGRGFDGGWETWQVWQIWEESPNPDGLPVGPIKLVLSLGFVGLLAQTVAEIVTCLLVLAGREDAARSGGELSTAT